jgi:hypothetical protein
MHKLHTIVGWVGTSMTGIILAFLPGYLNNPSTTSLKVMIGCGIGAVICFLVWLFTAEKKNEVAPSIAQSVTGGVGGAQQVGDGNSIFQTINQVPRILTTRTAFSITAKLCNLPPYLDAKNSVNLDNAGVLKLWVPYSLSSVTVCIDPTVSNFPNDNPFVTIGSSVVPGSVQMTFGKLQEYVFDRVSNKRHDIEVGGRVFSVTLMEVNPVNIPGIAPTFEYVFGISEV